MTGKTNRNQNDYFHNHAIPQRCSDVEYFRFRTPNDRDAWSFWVWKRRVGQLSYLGKMMNVKQTLLLNTKQQ